ncbi:hypothetical protein Acr_00g0011100 [Actinidia rufa]|uniref:LOB domain-containing protein n=1 Tax=Actinidia rufa TaxID=165716 RepID=A0A7J0D9B8_9ERIC|nr:hypothetical protein Acr_00g0011100 [Actinidia rufa]
MIWEAAAWDQDPVLGLLGLYESLGEEIPMHRVTMQFSVRLESSPRGQSPQSQEISSFVQDLEREQWKSWDMDKKQVLETSVGREICESDHMINLQDHEESDLIDHLHDKTEEYEKQANKFSVSLSNLTPIQFLKKQTLKFAIRLFHSKKKQGLLLLSLSYVSSKNGRLLHLVPTREESAQKTALWHPTFRKFQLVHRVFGVSNAIKIMKDLDFSEQKEAAEAMIWEAEAWKQDPVRGPLGLCERLEEQTQMLEEEIRMLGEQNSFRSREREWSH